MRRSILIIALILFLVLSTGFPMREPGVLAHHKAYFTANCQAAGQTTDDSCKNILFIEVSSADIGTYDPAYQYGIFGGAILGIVYDTPVEFTGATASVSSLAPSSAIKSIDVSNGTYYSFAIRTGIHARRLNATAPFDLGTITSEDWTYSILRSIAQCSPGGPAPVVYKFIYGASDWLNFCLQNPANATNEGILLANWKTFLSLDPVKALDATHFALKIDSDFNVSNGQQPYPPFPAILAANWAGMYKETEVEHQCGSLITHLAMTCSFMDGKHGIGTGPYLIDETNTDSSEIILRRNENYCEGERTDPTVCSAPAIGGPLHTARLKTIVFKAVPEENTRVQDLLSGRADMVDLDHSFYSQFLDTSDAYLSVLPNLQGEINFTVVPTLFVNLLGLLVHRTSSAHAQWGVSPLEGDCPKSNGCKVRRAIIAAFNYTANLEQVVRTLGTQLASFLPTGLTTSAADAVAAGVLQAPRQNLTLTTQLLQQAGYNSTNPLNLKCGYPVESEEWRDTCFQLATDLTQITDSAGNRFVLTGTEGNTGRQYFDAVGGQKYDISNLLFGPDYAAEDDYMRGFAASDTFIAPVVGYANSTIDAEIDRAASLPEGIQRTNIYFDIMRTINQQCSCYVWREQPEDRAIISTAISGFNLRGTNPVYLSYYKDLQKTLLTGQNTSPPPNNYILFTVGGIIVVLVIGAVTVMRLRRAERIKKTA